MKYFLANKKFIFLCIKEKANKNARQVPKSYGFPGIISLSPIIPLEKKNLLSFSSDQACFVSWHLCFCYNRQLTKHMKQSSYEAYEYYVKLLLNKNNYRLTNDFAGIGVKH